MKKILYLFILGLIIWLIKLSYDHFSLQEKVELLQQTQHKSEQLVASLNDQLVAIQRSNQQVSSQSNPPQQNNNQQEIQSEINPIKLLSQKLELIQFALDQHEFVYALEQLNQLDQLVERLALADTLQVSMHRAVEHDQKMIQQYVVAKNIQMAQLGDLLENIDANLKNEQQVQQLKSDNSSQSSWFERVFKVERVDEQMPVLLNRRLVLKEVQLRVLFAQRALQQGQYIDYQNALTSIIDELDQLPDAAAIKIKNKVKHLKQAQLLPVPKLNSKAILEG
ncbi:hypothetical protein [Acinetobacter sp. YH16032]|uniref:hypothetical protein n=1 Tax=Acinetobacter sp. YH16032 TaxID=2601181 RepID=UPI0015D24307|nr:hypothetical protein [Acinetobacter sp. YH16032]